MATATAVVTINAYPNGVDNTLRHEVVFGTLAVSASPATYLTNGLPVTFDTASKEKVKSSTLVPMWGFIQGVAGYQYTYDPVHGTIRIFESPAVASAPSVAAPGTELTNGSAIPAGVSGDTIFVRFEVNRNI